MSDPHADLIAMAGEIGAATIKVPHCATVLFEFTARDLAAFERAILARAAKDVERFEFEEYPYHSEAMGCGLEDRGITDRYEAMAYGWNRAMERAAESIPDDLVSASTVASLQARIGELEAQLLAAQKDLNDAATSLHTISTLAGRSTYGSPPIESNLGTFQEVRAYANSRHQAAIARSKA